MRMSKMYFKTYHDDPADAVIPSHKLMLRAGMIRQQASGVYSFMQPGWRAVRKVEQIVREEMDRTGAQEIHMSAVIPAELWQETGRWNEYGPELWRIKDRHGRDFCLGPTHEECFTDVARNDLTSYKQLPVNLYQIQTKYRDEDRPRFGLLRSREFIMKDAYSFDVDQEGLDKSYMDMYHAYEKVFKRCGLDCRPVEADTGAIGGSNSHEFSALSEVGESDLFYCDKCGMAATDERCACVDAKAQDDVEMLPLEKKETPGTKTIEAVCDYLHLDKKQTIKALLFVTYDEATLKENGYVAAFVRGDRDVNMIKLVNALNIPEFCIAFADEEKMGPATGCVGGFTGPMGLHDCTIVVDSELPGLKNLCAGACEKDHHYINVNYGRDYKGDIVTDIKMMKEGDPCPVCGAPVKHTKGIEVGQVFKLGTKYSESMGAYYLDQKQEKHPIVMGCYGIGVTRTVAAVVEQHHDEKGIVWPVSVAPYHVMITVIKPSDEKQMEVALHIQDELEKQGVEVLVDDRDERAGVKFNDADLLGYPVMITVGGKASDGIVEYKLRRDEDHMEEISADEAVKRAADLVAAERFGC
ncbi:MAG: proline--tRNA ligase [Eubacterium sp.]|jgi:prolyl-tRNA synthetase|uniref:proline--tRNA ligase n=1 Tax=Eubacterium sp. F2 TaxID=3381348 RepID=UPI003908436B|nr:proline--tRNA ligase [Eubacterium sp.]MCI2198025.1 proline--tRNA ligase [Eubacterium sp.]